MDNLLCGALSVDKNIVILQCNPPRKSKQIKTLTTHIFFRCFDHSTPRDSIDLFEIIIILFLSPAHIFFISIIASFLRLFSMLQLSHSFSLSLPLCVSVSFLSVQLYGNVCLCVCVSTLNMRSNAENIRVHALALLISRARVTTLT